MPVVMRSLRLVFAFVWLSGCATSAPLPVSAPAQPAPVARAAQAPARGVPAASDQPGVAVGANGAVASAESHASEAGIAVLKAGGNAVDAAIAVAFALAVTHPSAGNIGGGGFMVVQLADGQRTAIDYREVAPLAATRDMYLDASGNPTKASVIGPLAAGVPGTVAGLELAHARFGSRPWAELVAPAVALARDGHAIDASHAESMQAAVKQMQELGFADSARVYLAADGQPIPAGGIWKQPELAATLQRIGQHGATAFYSGPLSQEIVQRMQQVGGIWTQRDLADYKALEREPLRFEYLGHEVITMPPPSGGGIVMRQILYASELFDIRKYPARSPEAFHIYLEATRRAYADRNEWLGDPAFVDIPVAGLLDPNYIKTRMSGIDPAHATPSSQIRAGTPEQVAYETTHFSVVDRAGNAVSNTYTLNTGFGSKVVLPGLGILLNNEMDDFAAAPGKPNAYGLVQGERNAIAPKKRMLSSMSPTVLRKNGELRAVLGTPGGPTITTTVVQLVRALVDYGIPLDQAVRAPRVHHQWLPDQVFVEPDAEPELVEGLRAKGHKIETVTFTGGKIGHADCIEVDPATRGFRAVADVTRGGGSAQAY
ncbi:MAG TPA: gamma-glutamyltransferase [Polyangiales bacterium]|nr:gamma-glutamyltransferase [Polyangiales bacterium]